MKTQPLREDKHCLNCGTEVPERYCTHCGQENAVPHESFGHLVKHFVGDVLHYDSQFLTTLSHLLFRPGRLTKEYMAGRRVAFVNPIKLYIFVSFVFFLTWAMLSHDSHEKREKHSAQKEAAASEEHDEEELEKLPSVTSILGAVKDSLKNNKELARAVDSLAYRYRYDSSHRYDSALHKALNHDSAIAGEKDSILQNNVELANELDPRKKYADEEAYDSAQAALPKAQRDGWFKRYVTHKWMRVNLGDDRFQETLGEALKHHFPKMMFVLLPLFALWLKLIYNWKRWYYTDHAIFALHVHCFAYTVLLLAYILEKLTGVNSFIGWSVWLIFGYLVLALRNTYHQSFMRSFGKSLLLLLGYGFSFAFVGLFFILIIFAVIL
ncbi:MAG TPA: DUF3667 domain-containing protein [Chitinophaga sp.]|uniref:DUF3667 domain-containing protein n=1 Tax=Chitinophaga sp. TaxID=1869181 RepID=UPI002F941032